MTNRPVQVGVIGTGALGYHHARLLRKLPGVLGDDASADEIVTDELEASSFEVVCDSLLLPTLAELKRDAAAGVITALQVRRAIRIIDLVCDVEALPDSAEPKFVCIAAQNEIDDCVARLLACAAARARDACPGAAHTQRDGMTRTAARGRIAIR